MELKVIQSLLSRYVRRGASLKTSQGIYFLLYASLCESKGKTGLEVLYYSPEKNFSTWHSYCLSHCDADSKTGKIYMACSGTEYVQVISAQSDQILKAVRAARAEYLQLTNTTIREIARGQNWPIRENHCLQRVLLDQLFGGPWYSFLPKGPRPAYQQLEIPELGNLLRLTYQLLLGGRPLAEVWNKQSLGWNRVERSKGNF